MERWTRTPEGTWNVLRTFEETHAISAMANSTSLGCEAERQKTKKSSQCELFLLLLNFKSFALRMISAKFIRLSWITSDENIRIREKALRNESLDRSNAKDLAQVVRILRKVDVVSAFSSSTLQVVSKSAHRRWRFAVLPQAVWKTVRTKHERLEPMLLRTQLQDTRKGA